MNPSWVAVIGTAIGSAGATWAALVSGWFGRRQASIQVASTQEQWRWQMRRDAYGALLRAGTEARDELGAILNLLRAIDPADDRKVLEARLEQAKSLVNAVRLATSTVVVEGPPSIIEPAKRIEEGIVLFHTAMAAVIRENPSAPSSNAASFMAICSQQRVSVRAVLTDFAGAARATIDQEPIGPATVTSVDTQEVEPELSWLIESMAHVLSIPAGEIDPDGSLFEHGLDSISVLALTLSFRREHGMTIDLHWFFSVGQHSIREAAALLKMRQADSATTGENDPKQITPGSVGVVN